MKGSEVTFAVQIKVCVEHFLVRSGSSDVTAGVKHTPVPVQRHTLYPPGDDSHTHSGTGERDQQSNTRRGSRSLKPEAEMI